MVETNTETPNILFEYLKYDFKSYLNSENKAKVSKTPHHVAAYFGTRFDIDNWSEQTSREAEVLLILAREKIDSICDSSENYHDISRATTTKNLPYFYETNLNILYRLIQGEIKLSENLHVNEREKLANSLIKKSIKYDPYAYEQDRLQQMIESKLIIGGKK